MEIQIIGKNGLKITEEAEQYVQKKIGKLQRYLPDLDDVKVEIVQEKTKSREDSFIVQATLVHKGMLLRGEEKNINIHAAVDAVSEVLERQIERYKGKYQKNAKGSPTVRQSVPVEHGITIMGDDIREKSLSSRITKVKHFVIARVTVDEAVEQMELLNHDFFLFVNNDNNVLSLVYRRKNGNYGLIEPEIAS